MKSFTRLADKTGALRFIQQQNSHTDLNCSAKKESVTEMKVFKANPDIHLNEVDLIYYFIK